jgi:SRSO17 transposase
MRGEEEDEMTKRIEIAPAPEPLEAYARHFDAVLGKSNQREEFRRYLQGLLLPSERHKTLTGLVNTEPEVGAQLPRAQKLQWFLSESTWDERQVQAERLTLLREDPATAPTADGVLVIDETGDRKDGHHTTHVGRQYLANLGKIDNGVVSVTSLWADERVYYPVDVEPYTPAHYFEKGKQDPHFRTKLKIAVELVQRAVQARIPFRAVVADSFYGEDRGVKRGLRELGVGYVLALKPSHAWWHPVRAIGSFQEAARAGRWKSGERPGAWIKVTRTFRDGSSQQWWALEVITGPYGPHKQERVVIATTDPLTLPDLTTLYLVTNLPAPASPRAAESSLAEASLEEVVRLYGLRMWVEQSYKQVKHTLGWSQYQVRSDRAIRRHWQLVCCAFSFCWYHVSHPTPTIVQEPAQRTEASAVSEVDVPASEAGTGKKKQRGRPRATPGVLAISTASGPRMAGAMDHAAALLAWVVRAAPTSGVATPAHLA